MTGRLARYAAYQLRDYIVERGLPTILIGGILFLPLIFALVVPTQGERLDSLLFTGTLEAVLPIFGFVAVLLGINGIVSNDRHKGYFRFLFAKPIRVVFFYLQAFVVNGVGSVAAAGIVIFALGALAGTAVPFGVLGYVALFYIVAGGLGFLLSTLTRFDWVGLGLIWVLAQTLRQLTAQIGGWYYEVLDVLLPPAHIMSQLASEVVHGGGARQSSLLWIAGYGALSLLLGLIALHRRPLAR